MTKLEKLEMSINEKATDKIFRLRNNADSAHDEYKYNLYIACSKTKGQWFSHGGYGTWVAGFNNLNEIKEFIRDYKETNR